MLGFLSKLIGGSKSENGYQNDSTNRCLNQSAFYILSVAQQRPAKECSQEIRRVLRSTCQKLTMKLPFKTQADALPLDITGKDALYQEGTS